MIASPRNLFRLKASDLMTTNLVALPMQMSLQAAARILSRAGVTGAPVVDDDGALVGVFSATDIMMNSEQAAPTDRAKSDECLWHAWCIPDDPSMRKPTSVGEMMTRDPVAVSPVADVAEIARLMCDEHIHRVVVIDLCHRPIGIISTMDILSALVHAANGDLEVAPVGSAVESTPMSLYEV